ncbi:hypothetical protein N7522_001501 [Penicillium canescens]|nr:hypothetical protein N7522_001501 [Penicillium canescens]
MTAGLQAQVLHRNLVVMSPSHRPQNPQKLTIIFSVMEFKDTLIKFLSALLEAIESKPDDLCPLPICLILGPANRHPDRVQSESEFDPARKPYTNV